MGLRVYVTKDMCDSYEKIIEHIDFYSEEFHCKHMALEWVVKNINSEDISSVVHWVYVVDERTKEIII